MKHVVCFSGGKDSTALILWAKANLPEFMTVFCDTGWEHPITYAYVEEINQTILDGKLVTLKNPKWEGGLVQLCTHKQMIPHASVRFCTSELKIIPLHKYYQSLDDEVTSYQGIRADESASRAAMTPRQWVDDAGGYWIVRPLLRWSARECFELMENHKVRPNPLYLLGMSRVGCFPCVNVNLSELKIALSTLPEIRQRIIDLETASGQTFFKPGFIPERFCSRRIEGYRPMPTAEDVFRYIESVDEDQMPMFPARQCMSVYNLCE